MDSSISSAVDELTRLASDPVAFVREYLGAEPEIWQAAALQAIASDDRVAIRSGHGVGKSSLFAWVILWWLCTRYPAKVACTAPTAHQLSDVLWGELAKWMRRLPDAFRDEFEHKAEMLSAKRAPLEQFAVARTARRENPEAFQGFHSENMLFLVDEASGVDDLIFEVGEGAMSTEGAKTIMGGNPTRRSGYFFRAFHADRAKWHCIHVRCQDSSRVSPDYSKEMAEKYGEDSDIYRIRVLGEFPVSTSAQFIGGELLEICRAYKAEGYAALPKILACDVARYGDDKTVIGWRQGRKVTILGKHSGLDLMRTADLIAEAIKAEKPAAVVIDDVGIGAGVVDRLRQLGHQVHAFNGGGKAFDTALYANRRAETWGLLRDAMREGIELPKDNELHDDLVGPEYAFTPKQQIILERKEDMKKRGLASPDIADMLAMTFAVNPVAQMTKVKPAAPRPIVSAGGWMR